MSRCGGVLWGCAIVVLLACAGCTSDRPAAMSAPDGIAAGGAGGAGGAGAQVAPPQGGSGGGAGTPGALAGSGGAMQSGAASDASMQQPSNAGARSDAAVPPAAGASADAGTQTPEDWSLLMEESWTLPPSGEVPQWCADLPLTEDVYVAAIRPIHPPGTHHTTLSITQSGTGCSTASVLQNGILYAAGVGSEALRMPPGVALKLPAGQVLRLGLHLYNVTDQPLSGVSGIEILRVDPADVEHEAELMLAGPLQLSIDPGRQVVTHSCLVNTAQTVFAIFPHMHQLGVHMKTTALAGGRSHVLHDAPYAFEEQYQIPVSPLALSPGDRITTECTYENTTDRVVGFGESSTTEMCFSILYRYPATGNSLCAR